MYRIGIDLGGTNIAAGLVDENGRILNKLSSPTQAYRGAEAILSDIAALSAEVSAGHAVEGVGVAVPGTADRTAGVFLYAPNLPFVSYPLAERLSALVGAPVRLTNDAGAALWAEVHYGAAKGAKNAVLFTLGTGVGGGLMVNGTLYDGEGGAGAELGHTVIEMNGRPCGCGRRGCLEAYASATGLALTYKEERAARGLPDAPDSGKAIFAAAEAKEEAATAALARYTSHLATGVANMVNVFRPEAVLIGGGLSHASEALLAPLRRALETEVYMGKSAPFPRICPTALGNDAGIIGAALCP